jgi:hypothetical protein
MPLPATSARMDSAVRPVLSIVIRGADSKAPFEDESAQSFARVYTGGLHASIYRPLPREAYWWEAWWDRRARTDFAAAYQRGRFLNQLNWYSQLAVLISFFERPVRCHNSVRTPGPHLQPIFDIRRHLLDLAKVADDNCVDLRSRISQEFHDFLRQFSSRDVKERVIEVIRDLSGQPDRHWAMRDAACAKLNDLLVKPFIQSLGSLLQADLTGPTRSAFRIGERVDAGIRRPDVCEFLNPCVFDPRFVKHPLVNFSPVAGSILPERSWSKKVLTLARSLGIEGVLKPLHDSASPLQFNCGRKRKAQPYVECTELAAMVHDLDKRVYAALCDRASGWFHQEEESPGTVYKFGPIKGRLKQFAKWLGRDERTIKGKARAGIFWVRRLGRYEYEFWFRTESYLRLCAEGSEDASQTRKRDLSTDAG